MLPFTRRLTLVVVALLSAACADAPTVSVPLSASRRETGAQREVIDYHYDFGDDNWVQFYCEDGTVNEPVHIVGQTYERYAVTTTPSGQQQLVASVQSNGISGVGVVSGQAYRVVDRRESAAHYDDFGDGQRVGSMHETWTFARRDTHATFGVTYRVQWRLDENSGLRVEREKESETCNP